jgi:beta-carotene hydroxylase
VGMHTYKVSHLYHHKRYPHEDDVEGAAARMTLMRSLLEGVIFQFKIYFWVLSSGRKNKQFLWVIAEGMIISFLIVLSVLSLSYTYAFFVYMCLTVAGSWIIPLVTSYLVHTPEGETELQQTRLFRGKFFSVIAFDHLYHLEHHMYPMVPHKNWPELAKRLDYYFDAHEVKALELKPSNLK